MHQKLQNLKNEALARIISAGSAEELEDIRIQYLGKSGQLAEIAGQFKNLPPEERVETGRLFNDIKTAISSAIESSPLKVVSTASVSDFDPTLPGIKPVIGHLHPVTQAVNEIAAIFEKVGFTRVRYPEADWDWYAFGALNFPKDHPARDDWETFFVDVPPDKKFGPLVLTPHTSNGQVREMERVKTPPIRMINIAKCYRRQSDISHTPMFHQFEGLVIDEHITIANLRGTIEYFVKSFFGPNRTSRLRPYHFQFTEPSFEVDISCGICNGKGCRLCKEGWLELGGSGMVHPEVLKAGKIDPQKYSGFAFGWGVERCYMMKSGTKIDDIRLLYDNDIRFLNQF
jgi:phenylalanyl-tRNA synthetase alpha chain